MCAPPPAPPPGSRSATHSSSCRMPAAHVGPFLLGFFIVTNWLHGSLLTHLLPPSFPVLLALFFSQKPLHHLYSQQTQPLDCAFRSRSSVPFSPSTCHHLSSLSPLLFGGRDQSLPVPFLLSSCTVPFRPSCILLPGTVAVCPSSVSVISCYLSVRQF